MRKISITVLFAALSFSAFGQGTRVGIVDMNFLVDDASAAVSIKDRLKREFEPREEAIEDCYENVEQLTKAFTRAKDSKDQSKIKRQAVKLQKENKRCLELKTVFRSDLEKRNTSEMKTFIGAVEDVTADIAEKRKLDLVLIKGSALYVGAAIDITQEIMKGLEKTKPRKSRGGSVAKVRQKKK